MNNLIETLEEIKRTEGSITERILAISHQRDDNSATAAILQYEQIRADFGYSPEEALSKMEQHYGGQSKWVK